jgi:serine/threonine protein kinase
MKMSFLITTATSEIPSGESTNHPIHGIRIYSSIRFYSYLVMDLCWASMLDFCLGRLMPTLDVSDTVEMGRIMSETARGLHFLHRNNIVHGRLGLDRILLWRKRSNVKPIAKISGYYPHHHHNQVQP